MRLVLTTPDYVLLDVEVFLLRRRKPKNRDEARPTPHVISIPFGFGSTS